MKPPALIPRFIVGGILLSTGIGKLLDVPGFIKVLQTYQAFPEWTLPLVAICFVLFELRIAENLLLGKVLYQSSLAAVIFHVFLLAGVTLSLIRGLEIPNCGCFGVFLARPLSWLTFFEDLGMLLISLWMFQIISKNQQVSNIKRDGE